MLKTKVTTSVLTGGYDAGVEVAKKLGDVQNSKLNFLFTSCVMNQKDIVSGVKSVLGNDSKIIGCTSSGAIMTQEGLIDNPEGFAGLMNFSDENLTVGVACSPKKGDARELGKKIAKQAVLDAGLNKVPSYFYMVASPKEEEAYLKGIEDVIGTVPFFGGSAADNTVEGNWSIICGDKVFSDGCAVAFFYDNNECVTEYTGAYNETDDVGIITKVKDNRCLVEINGKKALQQYSEWRGISLDKLMGGNLLVETILSPLGVKDILGNVTAIRHPMAGNEDLTMNIGNNIEEKTAVIRMEATVDELIKSTSNTLRSLNSKMNKTAAGYLLVHCGGRKLGIGDRMQEVYNEVKSVIGDKPFMMVFTFGEYGYSDHSANTCGGLMLSFTGFSK